MEPVEDLTCGVDNHDDDCLCDVIVSQETAINRLAVQGMWMGQEVADACGLENWDDDQELLTYLCNVLLLHDRFTEQQQRLRTEPERLVPASNRTTIHPYKRIRVTIQRAMCEPGAHILGVLKEHNITASEFTLAASSGHWSLDEETLAHFEREIMTDNYSVAKLSKQYGVNPNSLGRFRKFWPNRPEKRFIPGDGTHPRTVRIRELIRTGVPYSAIIETIKREFGVTITKAAISQQKRRHNLSSHDTTHA